MVRRSGAAGILEDSAGEEPQSHLESDIFTVSKEDAKQPTSEAAQSLVESLDASSQPPLESTIFTVSKEESNQPLKPSLESILLIDSTDDSKQLQSEPPSKRTPTQSQTFAGATFTPVSKEDVPQPLSQPQPLLEPALNKISREDVAQPPSQPRNPSIISALAPSLSEPHQQSHTRVIKSAAPSSPEEDWRRFLQPPYVAPQVSLLKC